MRHWNVGIIGYGIVFGSPARDVVQLGNAETRNVRLVRNLVGRVMEVRSVGVALQRVAAMMAFLLLLVDGGEFG